MKQGLHYIFCLMAMVLMLMGCETDDFQNQPEGDTYLSLCIGMPDVAGASRATRDMKDEELDMDHGQDSEFALYNAQLLIFEEDETHANDYKYSKLCYVTELPMQPAPSAGSDPHVSQRYTFENLLLEGFERKNDKKYYGLIVANYYGQPYSVDANEGNNVYSKFCDDKLVDNDKISRTIGDDTYLLMTNTMLFGSTGSTAAENNPDPEELVDITEKLKYEPVTQETDYAVFYIERVAAKIQVDIASGKEQGTLKDGTPYKITGWKIINQLNDTYLMRHWETAWPTLYSQKYADPSTDSHKYRFLSKEEVDNGLGKYRGYFAWSIASGVADRFGERVTSKDWHYKFGNYDYCVENTFPVKYMMMMNSTHVLVSVEFTDKNSDNQDVTTTEYYLIPIKHFGDDYTPWRNGEDTNDPVLPIELDNNHSVSPAGYTDKSGNESVYINTVDLKIMPNINKSYPDNNGTRNGNYLGRWGVVRNNWYVITINGILGRGLTVDPSSPIGETLPEYQLRFDPTPLDYYENNLQCEMTVKNWIVRDQSAVLQ